MSKFHTYVALDEISNKNHTKKPTSFATILINFGDLGRKKRVEHGKIQRFGNANPNDMELMMRLTGYDEQKIKMTRRKEQEACPIDASSGRPSDRKMIS